MIEYRPAVPQDAEAVALLHTRSWRENYRGAFEDAFLDGDLPEERLRVWRKRLHDPPDHRSLSRMPCHVGSLPPSSIPADVNGRHTVSMGTGMPSVDAATKSEGWEPRWARFLYARVARVYNWIRPFWSSRAAESRLDFLFAERIGDGTRVLELAPGTGINIERLLRLAPKFHSYLGIDVSSAMLDRARVAARNDSRVMLQIGDATDLSALEGSFDFVVCTWLLSHLDHPERAVRGALDYLEPGGTAAFLFFTRADNPVVRGLVALFLRVSRCTLVDADAISSLPHLEVMHRHGRGYATLAIFRRPRIR